MAMKDITDLQVVQAVNEFQTIEIHKSKGMDIYEILYYKTQCSKIRYRLLERAFKRDLIDYKTSFRDAWLTKKGKYLLSSNV